MDDRMGAVTSRTSKMRIRSKSLVEMQALDHPRRKAQRQINLNGISPAAGCDPHSEGLWLDLNTGLHFEFQFRNQVAPSRDPSVFRRADPQMNPAQLMT